MLKADEIKLNNINPLTVGDDIEQCVDQYLISRGYDITDPKDRRTIPHNELNRALRYTFNILFKPSGTLKDNCNSLIDYNNIDLLSAIANAFIDVCMSYNKSLGLLSFSFLVGCNYKTIYNWMHEGEELNPQRMHILNNIKECHKVEQIGLLNDSPVGALAVANNDVETGLEWSKQQAELTASNTIFVLPSERLNRLNLGKKED